ncbi:MAG: hypothetical protein ACKOW8_01505 [Flavobacteriales bacterium]
MSKENSVFCRAINDDADRAFQPIEVLDVDVQTETDESPLTFIHLTMKPSPKYVSDWWCNIRQNTFLENPATGEKLSMQLALNVPIHPRKHFFKKFNECIHVTLVFDAIPRNWGCFDLIEDNLSPLSGYTFLNIPRNNSGVYQL